MSKVIVAGGRDFKPEMMDHIELAYQLGLWDADEVVCGMAKGADLFGKKIAEDLWIPVKEFPANWKNNGRAAGVIRNEEMAEYADVLLVFPGGRGTANMIKLAKEKGLVVVHIEL